MVFPETDSAASAADAPRRERAVYGWVFWLLLLAFEFFLFRLPLMPSGDGPMHIYLSSTLWKLATHSSSLFSRDYGIRHLVQPYSFHYYLLIVLRHWFSADRAEQIFVALIWATLAIGFRLLARILGPGYPAVSLWVFPLLLSWPLGGGFFNYVFASGLLLFALVFYLRLIEGRLPARALSLFVVVLVLLVLAHPLPLMLLIVLIALDIALHLLHARRTGGTLRPPAWSVAALGLTCLAFVFPILIADRAQVSSSIETGLRFHGSYLRDLLDGRRLALFQVGNVFGWLYDLSMFAILPACVLLFWRSGGIGRLRSSTLTSADRLFLAAMLYLLATLFFPPNMNGSALFAVRMFFMVCLVAGPCTAGFVHGRAASRAVALTGACVSLLSLGLGWVYLRPVAESQQQIEQAPLPSNARGLFIQTPAGDQSAKIHMSYSLLFWQGARAFEQHDDVMIDTPWLQLTIVPVEGAPGSGLLDHFAPNSASENPNHLGEYLEQHPKIKAEALARADFVLFSDPQPDSPHPLQFAAAVLGEDTPMWTCKRQDFYAVCTKK
jgi:hypothetical protein